MKKAVAFLLALSMLVSAASCSDKNSSSDPQTETSSQAESSSQAETTDTCPKYQQYASMTPEEITAKLTLEQKADQMVQPAVYNVPPEQMKTNDYGSILSTVGCIDAPSWRNTVDSYQKSAVESDAGIPYIYGQDDVHGVNYCLGAVYFPHNIGQGAANNEKLAYQVGLITADEAKLCHMMWNFSPCVAQSVDPRWGRTYESYGSDLETIKKLSTAYTKGLIDGGLVACTKHFFADGNVTFGTGEQGDTKMLIDRGDAKLTDAEITELLKVYQQQIDAGVQTIMISHSSLNGVKMHENKEYISKLKNEMGFKGFIVSDWGAVQNITGSSYKEQIIKSVNAGIDMLMETDKFAEAKQIIVDAVTGGDISEQRVNDAVTRIIRVKKDAGLFDDPMLEKLKTKQQETGSLEYRKVAEKLVEESLVLLKNDNKLLPLKEGTKVYITGPAADSCQAQCGGWTIDWNGANTKNIAGVTTIKEAFERYAGDYKLEIITDAAKAKDADVVLLCVGEKPYAEWNGDTEDMKLCGKLGLDKNAEAIRQAKALGKPTVTCILAGRQVILDDSDYAGWDSVVMCYLPGSEGKGISDVLCGCADFKGKLPAPWYSSVDQIGTDKCFFKQGYGLTYGADFKPKTEPQTLLDTASETDTQDPAADGTKYTKGLFKDGVYVNDYAKIKINVPGDMQYFPIDSGTKEDRISQLTDEKDIAREKSQIYDAQFGNQKEGVFIVFINTKIGFPNASATEGSVLDCYKQWITAQAPSAQWQQRQKVTLGGQEFTRDVCRYNETAFDCLYLRKLDDDLMCGIYVTTADPARTPDYYEKLFC